MIRIIKLIYKSAAVLTASVVLLGTTLNVSAEIADPVLNNTEWNSFVEEKIAQDNTPGLTLVEVNGSETEYKNWGYSDLRDKTPVTENTVFGIGSCSKAFTALSIFLLQEEGKLSIEDSVSDYLPWWHVTWQGAEQDTKIWQLLNHCSGLPDSTLTKIPIGTDDSLKEETARIAENFELSYEPGTAFAYCNLGYDVLAYITETVSGKPFEEYVEQEIFLPLGMTSSGYDIPTAQGYRWFYGRITEYDEPPFKGCYGDGGLRSTARDMSCWINAQLGKTELPDKLSNAIAASHETPDAHRIEQSELTYEYFNGWCLYDGYMFHSGTVPSFSSYLIVDKQRNIGIFTISNSYINTPDYAANSLYQIMKGEAINREQLNVLDLMAVVDTFSLYITIAGLIGIVVVLLLIITQKKRLAKKEIIYKKEVRRLCIRLATLIPLLFLVVLLPKVIVWLIGYGWASYRMVNVWLPYSFLTAFVVIDVFLLFVIVSSVTRFLRCKHFDYSQDSSTL